MRVEVLKSKIHGAVITGASVEYEGSIRVDRDLMDAADLLPYEKVLVANIDNGERLETYVIEGPRGSGVIELNGAAARRGVPGQRLILIAFAGVEREDLDSFEPRVIHVGADNRPRPKVAAAGDATRPA